MARMFDTAEDWDDSGSTDENNDSEEEIVVDDFNPKLFGCQAAPVRTNWIWLLLPFGYAFRR